MEIRYDPEADAIYVSLREVEDGGVARSRRLGSYRRVVDYDEAGEVVGVELLEASRGLDLSAVPEADAIADAIRAFPRLSAA